MPEQDFSDDEPVLMSVQGRMLKKASNIFKGWLPKHVILKDKILRYFNIQNQWKLLINVKQFQIAP